MLTPVDYDDPIVNRIAKEFHLRYEEFAPLYDYQTREESAVPWEDVPEANKRLMIHVVASLLGALIIDPGSRLIDGSVGDDE